MSIRHKKKCGYANQILFFVLSFWFVFQVNAAENGLVAEYSLKWLVEPGNGALVISHSMLPNFYYKKKVILSENDFLAAAGLPGPGQKINISKVSAVTPEFGYLANLDWNNIEVVKVEVAFLKRDGVNVLAWGEGNDRSVNNIPVALSVKIPPNKEIIYFPWDVDSSYYSQLAAFRSVLEYLKRQNIDIAPGVVYSVTSKQDSMDLPGRVVSSIQELEHLILPAFLYINGQPALLGINISDGPLREVKLEIKDNFVHAALFSPQGFVAASIGKTFFAAGGQFCSMNNRVYATTYELVPYVISTMDGEEYHYTLGLDLLAGGEGNVYIMRPEFWANDERIFAFYVDKKKMHPEKIVLDKDIIQIKVKPGRYFLVYGASESVKFSGPDELKKWFIEKIKQRPRVDDSVPDYDNVTRIGKMSNVIWITVPNK